MKAADISPYEKLQVIDVNNGNRIEEGEGKLGIYGGAARLVEVGHVMIIISYKITKKAGAASPTVIHVDENNRRV